MSNPSVGLKTLLDGITWTNSPAPQIMHLYDKESSSYPSGGQLIITTWRKNGTLNRMSNYPIKQYTVQAWIAIDNQSDTTAIDQRIQDIEDAIDANNISSTRDYEINFDYDSNNTINDSFALLTFRMNELP